VFSVKKAIKYESIDVNMELKAFYLNKLNKKCFGFISIKEYKK